MKVICLDDEKLALQFMKQMLLKVGGLDVLQTFQYSVEALNYVLTTDEHIDIIFVDINMPEMNGLEFAEKVIEKKPHIHIVFVTAYNEYAVKAFELDALDYIVKPVSKERLIKTINRIKTENEPIVQPIDDDTLYIQLGQQLKMSIGNEVLEPLKWRTTKARELFLYLLQNRNTLVNKATIVDLLWENIDIDKAYSILYTTVYNIRTAIRTYSKYIELTNTNDGYLLRLHQVEVDVHKWEEQIRKLPQLSGTSIDAYEKVMQLNVGPYLNEYDYIWVEAEKQRLENIWHLHALKIAKYFKKIKNINSAVKWYLKIAQRVPELEEAHLELMILLAEKKNYREVIKQYDAYVAVQKSYDLQPSAKINEWFEAFLQESNVKGE